MSSPAPHDLLDQPRRDIGAARCGTCELFEHLGGEAQLGRRPQQAGGIRINRRLRCPSCRAPWLAPADPAWGHAVHSRTVPLRPATVTGERGRNSHG